MTLTTVSADLRKTTSRIPRGIWSYLAFILLYAITGVISPSNFGPNALLATCAFGFVVTLAAAGETLVMIQGGIDLSVPYTISLGALSCLAALPRLGIGGAVVLSLGVGATVGLVNGLGVNLLRITPVVVTIAVNGALLGIELLVFHANPSNVPSLLTRVTAGHVSVGSLEIPGVILLGLALLLPLQAVLSWTGWGRSLYLLGANRRLSHLVGLRVGLASTSGYVAAGVLTAIAGLVIAGFYSGATNDMGNAYLLVAVAAVVLGGASIFGGRGSLLGTLGGGLLLAQISTLVTVLGIGVNAQELFYGVILIAAVVIAGSEKRS